VLLDFCSLSPRIPATYLTPELPRAEAGKSLLTLGMNASDTEHKMLSCAHCWEPRHLSTAPQH
jgi:hypothetical protein